MWLFLFNFTSYIEYDELPNYMSGGNFRYAAHITLLNSCSLDLVKQQKILNSRNRLWFGQILFIITKKTYIIIFKLNTLKAKNMNLYVFVKLIRCYFIRYIYALYYDAIPVHLRLYLDGKKAWAVFQDLAQMKCVETTSRIWKSLHYQEETFINAFVMLEKYSSCLFRQEVHSHKTKTVFTHPLWFCSTKFHLIDRYSSNTALSIEICTHI